MPALPASEVLGLATDMVDVLEAQVDEGTLRRAVADDLEAVVAATTAVALYSTVFDTLMTAVLPLQEYMAYWHRLRRQPLAAVYDVVAGSVRDVVGSAQTPGWGVHTLTMVVWC